jgi:Siphovirus Gp157
MRLYEIDSAIQAVYDQIEQNDGVLPDELELQLDGLQMERKEKIGNIVRLLKNIDGDCTKLAVEISMLQKKYKALENRKQSVRNYLAYAIGEGNSFKDTISSVSWNRSESVIVDESKIDMLPPFYVKTIKEPVKKLLKEAIEKGREFDGVTIETKQSMVVR